MIYVITFLIFGMGSIFYIVKEELYEKCKYKSLKKIFVFSSKNPLNGYFFEIMLTALGVTLAILFTNADIKKQEKTQTVEFLEVVQTELSTKADFIGGLLIDLQNDNNAEAIYSTMKVTPIAPILSLEVLLTDEPYNSIISSYGYSALLSGRMNFSIQQTKIETEDSSDDLKLDLLLMINELERSRKVINVELEYQNRELSKREVYEKIDNIMFTPMVIDITQYGFTINEIN